MKRHSSGARGPNLCGGLNMSQYSNREMQDERAYFGPVPDKDAEAIATALRASFAVEDVRFKPAVVSGNRALAIAYVDARAIMDRLDEVLGVDGWQDSYEMLSDGNVVCRLRLRINGEWITKVDVGSQSEGGDDGDKLKGAFSDSLKRAAVKFGCGRYLYRLPATWCAYDDSKKCFIHSPKLPSWAVPGSNGKAVSSKPQSTKVERLSVEEMLAWQEVIEGVKSLSQLNDLLPKSAALAHREDRLDCFHNAEAVARKLEMTWSPQSKLFIKKAKWS
jgi:hypothetical protein